MSKFDHFNLNDLFGVGFPHNYNNQYSRGSIFMCFTFTLLNVCHKHLCKIIQQVLLFDSAVPKINQWRLVNSFWRMIFAAICLISILLHMMTIADVNSRSFASFIKQAVTLPQCNITYFNLKTEEMHSEIVLSVSLSFFIHQIYVSISSYSEPTFFTMGGLIIFIFSANALRCSNLCTQVFFFLSVNVCSVELARVVYIIKSRCRGYEGPPVPAFLNRMALALFFLHIIVWIPVNLYLLPTLVLSQPSFTERPVGFRLSALYVNIFLVIFAKEQLFRSPAWALTKLLITSPSVVHRIRSLQSLPALVLLPYSSSLLTELKAIHWKFLSEAPPSRAEKQLLRKKLFSSGRDIATSTEAKGPTSTQAADLLSFLDCVRVLKRKMRHRYEAKRGTQAMSQDSCSETQILSTPYREESEEEAYIDEVTDIFIPVPTPPSDDSEKKEEPPQETVQSVSGSLESMQKKQVEVCEDEETEESE